ncbi:3145_t:CDS:2 [Ambispora leptoticha]|uniref:3145_t:CDS:1 n=1 Tax=Ambispora leptoticha TaxID=144679 RepID=A0A9N9EK60_9GLOM|nr:3145_t:CDS:2 [Ambispora leptoticha]
MLIGLRSGGLPSATKSKRWIDKVDLAVALRDVLINEGIENNGVEPDKFHKLFTLGVHIYYRKTGHIYASCYLRDLELYIVYEESGAKFLIDKARLYRTRRTSSYAMGCSICEHGRLTRTRRAKE